MMKTAKAKPARKSSKSSTPTAANKSVPIARTRGRYGRIIRLHPTMNAPALTEEVDRRVVMVMGPSGLKSIADKPALTMLSSIGYTSAYVERKLAEGFTFHLLTFPKPAGPKPISAKKGANQASDGKKPSVSKQSTSGKQPSTGKNRELAIATWKNTLTAISAAYPEIAHLVKIHAKELKRTSFGSFEEQAGFSFASVDKLGASDPRFMNLSRLLQSSGSACDLRRFLYHVTRLSELYNGDGRTRTEEGKPGVREYIMTNRPLTELGQYELTALHLNFASGQKLQG